MGLIKSSNVPLTASPFSMADIESTARGMLLRAKLKVEQLLAAAQAEAEAIKAQARADGEVQGHREGFARGMEEGRKAGELAALDENKAELQLTIAALADAANRLETSRADLESAGLQEVVKLSIAIAKRVTKRQGLLDPQVLVANLEEAMKLVVRQADLRIELNHINRKTFDAALPQLAMKWPALKHVEVVEDASLSPGGCRVTTCTGQIDADLGVQLDRVVSDLLPDAREVTA